jgi:hypothetical protein
MKIATARYGFVCGGFGMLLFAGAALSQTEGTSGSVGMSSIVNDAIDKTATSPDPASTNPSSKNANGETVADSVDACLADHACIDRYLWSLYERTPKIDTVKVTEQKKETVKRKGKTKTVTKTVSKLVGEDFAWKDPKAAEKAGMPAVDYVIGGMDPGFRRTLYRALRTLDDAGFKPGIMCAFRDDYRQSIATGLKAQNDRSYHGGSFRGGYGHGVAADIVSVRGETRAERLDSTVQLWEWIDKHEKELGIGRPYLDRDPPHVAPLDGEEYAAHRLQSVHAEAKAGKNSDGNRNRRGDKSAHVAVRDDRPTPKHEGPAKPSKTKNDGGAHARVIEPKHADAKATKGTGKNTGASAVIRDGHGTPKRVAMAKPQGRPPRGELGQVDPGIPREPKSKHGDRTAGMGMRASSARELARQRHL